MTAPRTDPSLPRIIRRLSRPLRPLPTRVRPRTQRLPGIRAILFDVYGTMFVSASGDIETSHHADPSFDEEIRRRHRRARRRGVVFPEVDVRRVWRSVRGNTSAQAVERFAVERECRMNPVWPMPGLQRVLAALRARGLLLGIVSNAQFFTPLLFPALLRETLEQAGFDPRLCVWSWQERQAKPSPRLLEKALARLWKAHGILPRETLMVGNDLLNDLLPAANAGCRTALFAGDRRSLRLRREHPDCANLRPDLILTSLPQLLAAVREVKKDDPHEQKRRADVRSRRHAD